MSPFEAYAATPVSTASDLENMQSNLAEDYYLTNDIDCISIADFSPVGDAATPFTGTFDGQGFTISNLTIERPAQDYVGLFGALSQAVVKNVTISNGIIYGDANVGGVAGYSSNNSVITDVVVNVAVSGSSSVGGLVGKNWLSSIENSAASGNVLSDGPITEGSGGGLVGVNGGVIINSYATGEVTAVKAGGLVGINWAHDPETTVTIRNCYAAGDVTGETYGAGLVAFNYSNDGISSHNYIQNCYATGDVTGTESPQYSLQYIGGLVSYNWNSTIENSYAVGNVSGDYVAGGFLGIDNQGEYNDNFWNTETAGQAKGWGEEDDDPLGISGKTTPELNDPATFVGWDFAATWTMNGYPSFRFEIEDSYLMAPDFNNDSVIDVFIFDSTLKRVYVWLLGAGAGEDVLIRDLETDEEARPISDVNEDGYDDILVKNTVTEEVTIWLMNGTTVIDEGAPGELSSYAIDNDAINNCDWDSGYCLLLRDSVTGKIHVWLEDTVTVPEIPITLSCPQGTTGVMLAESSDFADGYWEGYIAEKNIFISQGEGEKQLYAQCRNGAGERCSASQAVTLVVDTTKPQITITSPVNGFITSQPVLTVEGSFNEPCLKVFVESEGAVISGTDYSADITLNPGTNTIQARAIDLNGNVSTAATITVTLDT